VSRHVTDRLSAYLDGALGASALEQVEAHLEVCGSCSRAYQELQALQRMLRGLPEPPLSQGFADRLHWRLQREAAHPTRRGALRWFQVRPPFRVALACATMLLILGLPATWMADRLVPPETPLDTDAYIREYLVFSLDQPLVDEASPAFVISDSFAPESPRR